MALRPIERMAPVLAGADAAILTGDLTNFGDPPDAFRVVDAVRAHCPTVWAVTGNLDMAWVIDAFRDAGISLHGEARRGGRPRHLRPAPSKHSPPGNPPPPLVHQTTQRPG